MRAYRTCKQFPHNVVRDFEALTGEAQNSDEIDDGAEASGRPVVTKAHVAELKFVFEKLVECLETDDRLALLDRWVQNSQPLY